MRDLQLAGGAVGKQRFERNPRHSGVLRGDLDVPGAPGQPASDLQKPRSRVRLSGALAGDLTLHDPYRSPASRSTDASSTLRSQRPGSVQPTAPEAVLSSLRAVL